MKNVLRLSLPPFVVRGSVKNLLRLSPPPFVEGLLRLPQLFPSPLHLKDDRKVGLVPPAEAIILLSGLLPRSLWRIFKRNGSGTHVDRIMTTERFPVTYITLCSTLIGCCIRRMISLVVSLYPLTQIYVCVCVCVMECEVSIVFIHYTSIPIPYIMQGRGLWTTAAGLRWPLKGPFGALKVS